MTTPVAARLARQGVHELAPGVFQLTHTRLLRHALNCFYLASPSGGVLVDAGTVLCGARLQRQLDALHAELDTLQAQLPHQGRVPLT
jgi:hypothetical protein